MWTEYEQGVFAYNNHLPGSYDKYGLGFDMVEDLETGSRGMTMVVFPFEGACNNIEMPKTKEEFVEIAKELGIEWDINKVIDLDDLKWV